MCQPFLFFSGGKNIRVFIDSSTHWVQDKLMNRYSMTLLILLPLVWIYIVHNAYRLLKLDLFFYFMSPEKHTKASLTQLLMRSPHNRLFSRRLHCNLRVIADKYERCDFYFSYCHMLTIFSISSYTHNERERRDELHKKALPTIRQGRKEQWLWFSVSSPRPVFFYL